MVGNPNIQVTKRCAASISQEPYDSVRFIAYSDKNVKTENIKSTEKP